MIAVDISKDIYHYLLARSGQGGAGSSGIYSKMSILFTHQHFSTALQMSNRKQNSYHSTVTSSSRALMIISLFGV